MKPFRLFTRNGHRPERRPLKKLQAELLDLYQTILKTLQGLADSPQEGHALAQVNSQIAEVRLLVTAWIIQPDPPQASALQKCLGDQGQILLKKLAQEPPENHLARLAWTEFYALLIEAGRAIHLALPHSDENDHPRELPQVVIPCELLYQAYFHLFPAERMMVASGRREGAQTSLYALFDVTGECHSGYVRADPAALGRALLAMEHSGSFLMAWFHSHPGGGAEATHPSNIDQGQYQDWLQHFSPNLVCAILVQDRWIRFWGTNLEARSFQLNFLGNGLEKEDDHGTLYKLTL